MAEYAKRRTDGLMTNTTSWYVMGGYRFGRFMPHITYSDFKTDTNYTQANNTIPLLDGGNPTATAALQGAVGQITQFNTVNQKSVTMGLRIEVLPKVALKLEWQRLMADKSSNLLSPPLLGADTFWVGAGSRLDAVNIYTTSIDLIF